MENSHRPSLAGPAILIGLGILLVLQNLGYLPQGFWAAAWRLWPVLLIIMGLDALLGRRSALGSLIATILTLLLVVGGLLWASRVARGQGWQAEPVAVRQLVGEAERADVLLEFGAGQLTLDHAASNRYLVDGTTVAARETFEADGETARLELRHEARDVFVVPFAADFNRATWDLGLTGAIPLDLTVDVGVGQGVVDLTGLQLQDFDMDLGVGQAQVVFPAEGRLQASVSGGIGELAITLPANLPTRLTVSTGIGGFSAPASFVRRDNIYETPGFSTEGDYLDLTLSVGIGHITVK